MACTSVSCNAAASQHSRSDVCAQWQACVSFTGLCLDLFGPELGCENDKTLWARSGVAETLMLHIGPGPGDPPDRQYLAYGVRMQFQCVHCVVITATGDAGYTASLVLGVPESRAEEVYGAAERAFNHSMSAQRIAIEWVRGRRIGARVLIDANETRSFSTTS